MTKIAVIGTGYVGLGTGAVFADLGNEVIGVDIDAAKVAKLQSGQPHIFEPGLAELLERNLRVGRLRFTAEYADGQRSAGSLLNAFITASSTASGRLLRRVLARAGSIVSSWLISVAWLDASKGLPPVSIS